MFVEEQRMEPFNVRMIKLKPNTDVKGIFRFLAVKEKLGERLGSTAKKRFK